MSYIKTVHTTALLILLLFSSSINPLDRREAREGDMGRSPRRYCYSCVRNQTVLDLEGVQEPFGSHFFMKSP